jgi:hypothetical protein
LTLAFDDGKGGGLLPITPIPKSGASRTVTYALPGTYVVQAKVCDGAGACTTAKTMVLVLSPIGSTGKVVPLLDCVKISGSRLTAQWGYQNTSTSIITLGLGLGNFFFPAPTNQGQPTTFAAGVHHNVFTTTTANLGTVWVLNGRVAVAVNLAGVSSGVPTCS